jgi:hypothetical protein
MCYIHVLNLYIHHEHSQDGREHLKRQRVYCTTELSRAQLPRARVDTPELWSVASA